jgi:hypothetical protein
MADKIWTNGAADNDYSNAANWSSTGVPTAGDIVRLTPQFTGNITAGLDQSAVALNGFYVESGYSGTIATSTASLQINSTTIEFSGSGQAFLTIDPTSTASANVQVFGTASVGTGQYGLYLSHTSTADNQAIGVLNIAGGSVGIASIHGSTIVVTTVRITGGTARVQVGQGATVTTWDQNAGNGEIRQSVATVNVDGGTLTTREASTITTMTVGAGTVYPEATGNVTTMNINGGLVDATNSGASRTFATVNLRPGGILKFDPSAVTVTTLAPSTDPVQLTATSIA